MFLYYKRERVSDIPFLSIKMSHFPCHLHYIEDFKKIPFSANASPPIIIQYQILQEIALFLKSIFLKKFGFDVQFMLGYSYLYLHIYLCI